MAHDDDAAPARDMWLVEPRDGVVFTGSDATSYLHSQLSQEVAGLDVGESRWTMVLAPNGKVDAVARAWRRSDDTVVLDTDAGFGDVLEQRLRRFMIRVDVDVTREALTATMPPAGVDPDPTATHGLVVGWWGRGMVLLGAEPAAPASVAVAGADELRAARVRAGWPAMGVDIEPGERIAPEVGVIPVAVNFTKGCYPGQELVERMDSRGAQAPRRLSQVPAPADAKPGDAITADGDEVGWYTTVADGLALGYVKRGADIGIAIADLADV